MSNKWVETKPNLNSNILNHQVSNNEQLPDMVEQNIVICRRLVICDFHMS